MKKKRFIEILESIFAKKHKCVFYSTGKFENSDYAIGADNRTSGCNNFYGEVFLCKVCGKKTLKGDYTIRYY